MGLAHIAAVVTNGAVSAQFHGRKFTRKGAMHRASGKERRRVCLLSREAGDRLEHWHQNQPCFGPGCHHRHVKRATVEDLIQRAVARWLGSSRNVAAWTSARQWRPAVSAGFTVMQLRG